MLALSKRQIEVLEKLFPADSRGTAADLLAKKCGNSILLCDDHTSEQMDSIRLAAIKVSNGDISQLKLAIDLANTDWRDLLMCAGFGHEIDAHINWAQHLQEK